MSMPSYGSDPVYTPEEQRKRLAQLQNQYSQINTGGIDNFFNDAATNFGGSLLKTGATVPFGPFGGIVSSLAGTDQGKLATGALAALINKKINPPYVPPVIPASPTSDDPVYEAQLFAQRAADAEMQRQITEGNAFYNSLLGNTADTSGYDAALRNLGQERNKSKKRYQTYSAQISDLFGNLGRKSATYAQEQAGIGQQSAITRSQLAAQQAQQVGQTRSADAARLKAATEARAALGLGESASAGAAGDIATLRAEQGITDQQALGQTTIDTILANEALAKLVSSRQAGGFDMAGQQAQSELNMSYEDLLASLANAEAQTQMQRSQAISAGAASVADKLAVENARQNYFKGLASEGNVDSPEAAVTVWKKTNPNSAAAADRLLATFIPWVTSSAPNTINDTGKAPTFLQLVNAYSEAHPEGSKVLQSDPALLSLLQTYTGIK